MFKAHSKLFWISIAGIVAAIVIFGALYHFYDHKPPVIKPTPVNTSTGNSTKTGAVNSAAPVQVPTNSSNKPSPNSGVPTQSTLVAPSGSFVSNHKPNLGGSPAPNTEESVCDIPQYISCNITFTDNSTGKVLALGAQTAGANGVVAWRWSLQGVGITQGSWTIKAIATLNGQSKTTTDPITLDVQP